MAKGEYKKILDYKKAKFLSAVKRSAKYLGARVPKVKFWKKYDTSHFNQDDRAHIHVKENIICIAEPMLETMDSDEIEETASHEVSHLRHLSHDIGLQIAKINTKASLWSPPAGVVRITGQEISRKKGKTRKERVVKSRCNYHLCKKRGKTFQCKYCRGYFCKEHIEPKPPTRFNPENYKDMEEYHKLKGHPCAPYVEVYREEEEKEKEGYGEALGNILSLPKRTFEIKAPKISSYWHWYGKKIFRILIISIILLIVGYLLYSGKIFALFK